VYVKCLGKVVAEIILRRGWVIPNAVFVSAVALQTKPLLSSKFSATCYWPSSHCILDQKFVSVSAAFKSQPFHVGVGLDKGVRFRHSSSYSILIGLPVKVESRSVSLLHAAGTIVCFCGRFVLLVSSEQGRQHTPGQFSAACDETEMKLSTKKTEVRLSRN